MHKLRVGILFGGKSAEHHVSVRSARNVYDAIDRTRFEPVLIGITPAGKWVTANVDKLLNYPSEAMDQSVDNVAEDSVVMAPESKGEITSSQPMAGVDVIFPILHGPFGEDGTIQGLLKLADVPFVGASVLGSAVGMDKDIMKRLIRDAGFTVGDYAVVRRGQSVNTDELVHTLGLPLFVKPANLGSSVGVCKVVDAQSLQGAIDDALQYDNKILVEKAIVGREFECGVLGNELPKASSVGEVVPTKEFYSYDAKYVQADGATTKIPADIDGSVAAEIQDIAVKTFQALECEGLSRVDVFVTAENQVIVNEINTMPGFTSISMYPKLWEASGISYTDLITRLIELGIERYERDAKLKTSVDS